MATPTMTPLQSILNKNSGEHILPLPPKQTPSLGPSPRASFSFTGSVLDLGSILEIDTMHSRTLGLAFDEDKIVDLIDDKNENGNPMEIQITNSQQTKNTENDNENEIDLNIDDMGSDEDVDNEQENGNGVRKHTLSPFEGHLSPLSLSDIKKSQSIPESQPIDFGLEIEKDIIDDEPTLNTLNMDKRRSLRLHKRKSSIKFGSGVSSYLH